MKNMDLLGSFVIDVMLELKFGTSVCSITNKLCPELTGGLSFSYEYKYVFCLYRFYKCYFSSLLLCNMNWWFEFKLSLLGRILQLI